MNYTELDVWKESKELTSVIYKVTQSFPNQEVYGIINQMRRCAVSIPSNIAEGVGRQTTKDTISFLFIARGSLYELETQIHISKDLEYLNEEQKLTILLKIETCKKLINGFINFYKKKL